MASALENKKGTIRVRATTARNKLDLLAKIQREIIIIEATNHFIDDTIIYTGHSEQFREIAPYSKIPEYRVIINNKDNSIIFVEDK